MGFRFQKLLPIFFVLATLSFNSNAQTPSLPDSANPARFEQDQKQKIPEPRKKISQVKSIIEEPEIPDQAKNIKFVLKDLQIEGGAILTKAELEKFYSEYLNTQISLYTLWQIAEKITKHYHRKGYFLSIATVPPQEISKSGIAKIKIIEGYISDLELDEEAQKIEIARELVKKLESERPTNIKTLESVILRLNDLPGMSFESVIEPSPTNPGAVKLLILSKRKKDSGQITIDNYNSKFIGSNEGIFQYNKSLTQNSKTSVAYISSLPHGNLEYFNLDNQINIAPNLILGIDGSKTETDLGASLKNLEITSDSKNVGINLTHQFIRQRQRNFAVKFGLEGRNVSSEILSSVLAKDRIREAVVNFIYDGSDNLNGYSYINLTLTSGLTHFGSSKKTDNNLSRQRVDTNYKTVELLANRFQNFGYSFVMLTSLSAQLANSRLYSSSKFGYGGQYFGRGYEPSHITGDRGINGAIEMRYIAIPTWKNIYIVPFVYYDIGRVWNINEDEQILSSIGEGFRIEAKKNLSGSFTIANPIGNRSSGTPYYQHKDPRYLFQISYKF